jgi:hypothetical protein
MNNIVKVTAKDGKVVNSKDGAEYGYIRVESTQTSMENGFISSKKASALIRGKVEELKALGLKEGQSLSGKIIHKESTTPSYDGQSPKINPSTGEIMTSGGSPIFRESFFTANLNANDELLAHDKVEVPASSVAASL